MYKITIVVEDDKKDLILGAFGMFTGGMLSLGYKLPRITTEYVHEEPTT